MGEEVFAGKGLTFLNLNLFNLISYYCADDKNYFRKSDENFNYLLGRVHSS